MVLLSLFLFSLLAGAAQAGSRILVVGDSLSAAYGIDPAAGWTELLAQRLQAEGLGYQVVNASITGDTTRGALARLPRLLERHRPAVVILELGGNDGLRGIALPEMRANLGRMVTMSQEQGARVLLLGMHLPPNYGPAFTEAFHAVYHDLAAEHGVALVPFFLEGVADDEALFLPDRIHPNEQAQRQLLNNVWPALEPLLTTRPASRATPPADHEAASR